MDLKEFVATTLVQIIEGVADAQKVAEEMGAVINPRARATASSVTTGQGQAIHLVEFDVALTSIEGRTTSGGGGITVAFVRAGGEKETSATEASVSRVKFSVPVALPGDRRRKRFKHTL